MTNKKTPETEEEILEFWEKSRIYEKSIKKNEKGKPYYLMDGPPYATGSIHMGTALNKISKDIAMRFKRLQGFNVFDRPGYDTHGVPIEFQIEKEIGTKSKKDIEKYGVKKFIGKCKEFATKYIEVMNSEFKNLGVWMNWKNPYVTLDKEYIEAIWWTFKRAEEKKMLYLGKYPVHICPRCETAVAYNEIEYRKQDDTAVYVKFPTDEKNKFFIIWTTTPWTLPANTGIMAHPDMKYVEAELTNGEVWILAKDLLEKIMSSIETGFAIKKEFFGKELEGREYTNPLSKYLNIKTKNAYKIILSARYVNLEEGTGLVHSAPGHGKEDFDAAKTYNLDILSPLRLDGSFTEEAGKYSGKIARIVDKEIIEDLERDHALVYKHQYSHDYPICWRCKTPLLMMSVPQWFFKISEIQKKLLKENDKIKWQPSWMRERMKAWLEGIGDWPISRERYWGTPLPIWVCEKCKERKVISGGDELERLSKKKIKDLHKPEIDNIFINCKCGGKMKRISAVLDVWFDSGVSSWAALNFPKDKKNFGKFWPADLNIEGMDQIRGWWNSQLILSEIAFGKSPMKFIAVHGMVLDLGKKKMSKSLGNFISPKDIISKYNRDFLRYYFAKVSKGDNFAYDEKDFAEIGNFFRVLDNVSAFISQLENQKKSKKIEDLWILSRLHSTIENSGKYYDDTKFFEAIREIELFLVEDLSKRYIKIIRDRTNEAGDTLKEIEKNVLLLIAPIAPFIAEKIWQKLRERKIVSEESIHLSSWPRHDAKKIDAKLEEDFANLLKVIETGLKERDCAKIGLKWPLASADITAKFNLNDEMKELVKNQLNVKKVFFNRVEKADTITVKLDVNMTPELEAEGFAREISRKVQALRKEAGLIKSDTISLILLVTDNLRQKIGSFEEFIKERTNSRKLEIANHSNITDDKNIKIEKIKEEKVGILFKK